MLLMKKKISVNYLLEAIIDEGIQHFVLRVIVDPRQQPVVIGVFSSACDVADALDEFNDSLVNKSENNKDE